MPPNTETHTKSTHDLYSNYTTVDPKQLHRSHMKFRRQAQKGGHIIPDKANTLIKHLEPQTVSCLGKKNRNVSGTKLHHHRPKKKTLAEIAHKNLDVFCFRFRVQELNTSFRKPPNVQPLSLGTSAPSTHDASVHGWLWPLVVFATGGNTKIGCLRGKQATQIYQSSA